MPIPFNPRQLYTVLAVVFFAVIAFYSTYKLTESPPTWYDEGIYIQVAHIFAERGEQSVQIAPEVYRRVNFLTVGFPVLAPVALSLKIFGYSLFAARLPMVLFILIFSASAWLLIKKLYGPSRALLTLALIATFPLLYGNGKNVLGEIPGLFYACLALMALNRLENRKFFGPENYALLGFTVGLTAATKPVFLMLPLAMAVILLVHIRTIPIRFKEIIVAALAFLIPMSVWAFLQFGPDTSFQAILSYYANPYGVSSVPATVAQNLVRLFTESTPLYCTLLMAAWLLSMLIRVFSRRRITLAEQSAFVFSLIVLAAYLRTAGWYRYFFETLAMALIFAPASFETTVNFFSEKLRLPNAARYCTVATIAILIVIQAYQLNTTSWIATHNTSQMATQTERYFANWPSDKSIFIYNKPEAANLIATENYYQYMQPTEAISYGSEELPLLQTATPEYVLTDQTFYEKNPAIFSQYRPYENAGAYLLLSRK